MSTTTVNKMDIWTFFINIIIQSITFLTSEIGLSQAVAIIIFTFIARLILMPINTSAMINMHRNKQTLAKIKPELDKLKNVYKANPSEMAKQTMALYKKHNIKILDKTSVFNMTSQGIFGFGMFQAIQQMTFNSKFVWIANIAKPDILLALLVGAITYFSMVMMPGSAEQTSILLFVIPAIISFIALVNFPSAIGLYWATSSTLSLFQTLLIKQYFKYQEKHLAI